jgi:Ca2+-binding RTX toxin-like protein
MVPADTPEGVGLDRHCRWSLAWLDPADPRRTTSWGGSGADVIRGERGNDFIFAGSGADDVFGQAGNDQADGGRGSDDLFGGGGSDRMGGGGTNAVDRVSGGLGNDSCLSVTDGQGNDTVIGGAGIDTGDHDPGDVRMSLERFVPCFGD